MSAVHKTTIGAFEAKTNFSQLLERVSEGEEITITRHGNPVARLIPVRPIASVETRTEAIRQMRELAKRNSLGGLRLKDLIEEGRP